MNTYTLLEVVEDIPMATTGKLNPVLLALYNAINLAENQREELYKNVQGYSVLKVTITLHKT